MRTLLRVLSEDQWIQVHERTLSILSSTGVLDEIGIYWNMIECSDCGHAVDDFVTDRLPSCVTSR